MLIGCAMPQQSREYEIEIVDGLEELARQELRQLRHQIEIFPHHARRSSIRFKWDYAPQRLAQLRLAQAVYLVEHFAIPRPKALLGDAHFRRLVGSIHEVIRANHKGEFSTLGIDAAGADSSVMLRIKADLAKAVGLEVADKERGDLLLRIVPAMSGDGWECLIRLTARPLATRAWRVHNFPAALNATVAYAMILLTNPRPDEVFINLCTGSGTFLAERSLHAVSAQALVGIEHDAAILNLARANVSVTGSSIAPYLWLSDVTSCPMPDGVATALVADLPFGHRSGSHGENLWLYPRVLREAARISHASASFVVISHEIRLMEDVLRGQDVWITERVLPITLRGLHPRIYLLKRNV
jgi:tRNA (guanine6-N2)-methyltransferase